MTPIVSEHRSATDPPPRAGRLGGRSVGRAGVAEVRRDRFGGFLQDRVVVGGEPSNSPVRFCAGGEGAGLAGRGAVAMEGDEHVVVEAEDRVEPPGDELPGLDRTAVQEGLEQRPWLVFRPKVPPEFCRRLWRCWCGAGRRGWRRWRG